MTFRFQATQFDIFFAQKEKKWQHDTHVRTLVQLEAERSPIREMFFRSSV